MNIKIVIERGDMFEGSIEQWEDCFEFGRHDAGIPEENKLNYIKIWAEDNGYSFELVVDS